MKKFNLFLLATLVASLISCSSNQKVSSPDGAVEAQIVQENGLLALKVSLHGSEIAQWQIGGMSFEEEGFDFTGKLKQKGVSFAKIDEEYTIPTGKVSIYQNKANEMTVSYINGYGKAMRLLVRAYNDGVAFRYAFDNNETMQVKEERTTLVIPESSNVWAMEYMIESEDYFFKRSPFEMNNPLYALPVLVETTKGQWLLVHEADVLGRSAAASLSDYKGNGQFILTIEYTQANENAIMAFPYWSTPWRMMIVGDTPGTIVESVMTENLNPPSAINDMSWIKPGVAVFPWWGNNRANSDKELLKSYIDLAKEMGWTVLEFDIALIGSSARARDTWLTTPWIK